MKSAYHTMNIIVERSHHLFEIEFYTRLLDPESFRLLADMYEDMVSGHGIDTAVYYKANGDAEMLVLAVRVTNDAMETMDALPVNDEGEPAEN